MRLSPKERERVRERDMQKHRDSATLSTKNTGDVDLTSPVFFADKVAELSD
jgi:hypothetical protein